MIITPSQQKLREGFMKWDDNKRRISISPLKGYLCVLDVAAYGANKYAPHNWRKCIDKYRYADAAFRHLSSYISGEELDPESGLPHLAHAAFSILAELELFGSNNKEEKENE